MTIGELSKKAGVGLQAIRYYERLGLLAAPHRWPDSGYRDFDDDAFACLRFIRSTKAVGFTLKEIKRLLSLRIPPRGSCAEVAPHLTKKIAELDARIHEMRRMKNVLARMMGSCRRNRSGDTCLVLWTMENPATPNSPKRRRRKVS
jgi:MerR family copper efflux transcriptional regulator